MKTPEQFWSRVEKTEDGCWLWMGARTRDPYGNPSYGQLKYGDRIMVAHRVSWMITHGYDSAVKVLHKCDVTNCVNPEHLFEGTQADNMQDRKAKGRHTNYPDRDPVTGLWTHRPKEEEHV